VDRFEDRDPLAQIRSRSDPKAADQTGAEVGEDVAVKIGQAEDIVKLRFLDQLHAHVIDQPFFVLDLPFILLGDFARGGKEQAVGKLHDISLADRGHFFPAVLHRVFKSVFNDPLRAADRDRLDRDAGIRFDFLFTQLLNFGN